MLVARSGEKLNQVAAELQGKIGVAVKTIVLDLTAAPAANSCSISLQRERAAVDVLVNNAGFSIFGEFAGMAEEEILGQIQLNVTALTQLTGLLLPAMLARRKDYECGFDGSLSAGAVDGGILRDQGLCAVVL